MKSIYAKIKMGDRQTCFYYCGTGGYGHGKHSGFSSGAAVFHDLNCFKHYRHFYAITACGWKMVLAWIRDPDYRNMFAIPLVAPPMMAADLSRVRVRATWPKDTGACNGCAQCCTQRFCPLLDTKTNRCRSYGSFYWRYFNCGRYPERLLQIEYYECEKWEILDTPQP
jgi:hypothetical protein